MKKNFLKTILIILMSMVMIGALYACSPRPNQPEDPPAVHPGDKDVVLTEKMTQDAVKKSVANAMNNYNKLNSQSGVKEYFGIDLAISLKYVDYTVVPSTTTNVRAVVKGNFHLTDNTKSELFIELIDVNQGVVGLGIYYYDGVLYTSMPNSEQNGYSRHYAKELNLSSIGVALSGALSTVDIPAIIGSVFTGSGSGIAILDTVFGLLPIVAFDTSKARMTTYDKEMSRDYTYELKANTLLKYLKDGLPSVLESIIGFTEISWESFGLPDLDVLLEGIFGFSLRTIKEKKWPTMECGLSLITEKVDLIKDDGTKYQDYAYKGLGLNITTPESSKQKNEYSVDLAISPLKLGLVGTKVPISFSGLELGNGLDTTYKEGGIFNLEADASLIVENSAGAKITVGDILGTMLDGTVDLGSLKDLTINIPNQNTYEFNLNVKTDIDLFNSDKTKVELTLNWQDKPFIKGILIKDTLYLDMSALSDAKGQIVPNLKVSGVDLTKILGGLFGDAGMAFLDPNYILSAPANNPSNAESTIDNAAPVFDVMALLTILVNSAKFPTPGDQKLMIFDLDNAMVNDLLHMFLAGGDIGIDGIALSVDLYDILHSLTISLSVNEQFGAKIKVNNLSYFKTPDFANLDMILTPEGAIDPEKDKNFTDVMTNKNYNAEIGGNLQLGLNTVNNGAGKEDAMLDLSGLVGFVADNLLENLGIYIKVEDAQELTLTYLIKANVDMFNFTNLEFALNLYAGQRDPITNELLPFAVIYYSGADDTMYIDLSKLSLLQDKLPVMKMVGQIPLLKVPNIGLKDLLKDIVILQDPIKNGVFPGGTNIELDGEPTEVIGNIVSNMFLSSAVINRIKYEEGISNAPFDIMTFIGSAIDGVYIDTILNSLSIEINKQILSVLMTMLGKDIAMPHVNAYARLQLLGVPIDGAYFQIHLGILADNDQEVEAFALNINLIDKLGIYVGKTTLVNGFDSTLYKDINEWINDLKIGISLDGNLNLTSTEKEFSSDVLNAWLGNLIQGLALKLNLEVFGIDLGFELKGVIAIGMKADKSIDVEKLLKNSSVQIIFKDNVSQQNVLGIYLKDDNLYLELDYFGMQNIGITRVSKLITDIEELLPPTNLEKGKVEGGHAFTKPTNLASLDNPLALAIEIVLNNEGVTISLSKDVLAMLVGLLIKGDIPVAIKDTEIKLGLDDGIEISIKTGVECFELNANLGNLLLSFMGDQLPTITVPAKTFNMTESGMPKYLNVEIEGELSIHSIPGDGENSVDIDISPALKHLLPKVDLEAFIKFLGVVEGVIKIKVEGSIDLGALMGGTITFASFKDSAFKITIATVENGKDKVLLKAVMSDLNLYIDTEIMGIGKIIIKDLEHAFEDIENANPPKEDKNSNNPSNKEGDPTDPIIQTKSYLEIMFKPGGIGLAITKELFLTIIKVLSPNLAPYFEGIELKIDADLMINPIEISLVVDINGVDANLNIKNLNIGFDKKIDLGDLSDYYVYEKLASLGVDITGTFNLAVTSGTDGLRFDYLIQKLLVDKDGKPLLDVGLLLKVIGEEFGGTINYQIKGAIDLINIFNMNLGFIISATDGTQILSMYILGDGNALDLYIDLTKLGLEKIKIRDVQGLIGAFTPTSENGYNPPISLGLPKNERGEVNTADMIGAGIILSIASDSQLQAAPIALNVTSAAIYALIASFGIDLSEYLGEFTPHLKIEIGNNNLISLDIGLEKLLNLGLTLDVPNVSINPSKDDYDRIKNDNEYYWINSNNQMRVKVEISGKLNLDNFDTGEEDPNKPDKNKPIDLTNLVQYLFTHLNLGEANFGVLINSLFESRTTVKYSITASLDIIALAKGGDIGSIVNAIDALVYFSDENDEKLFSVYLNKGTLYADLSKINAGKIRIDNIGSMISGQSETSKLLESLNEENTGMTPEEQLSAFYISLSMSNSSGVMLTIFADVFRIILDTFDLPGDLIDDAVNGILELRLGLGTDGEYVQLQIDIASYKLDFRFSPLKINFKDYEIDFEYNPADYKTVDILGLNEIYVKLALDLSWNFDKGTNISFKDLISSLNVDLMGMDLAPILTIFEEIATTFRLKVEGIINFTDIFASTLKIQLFPVIEGKEGEEVLSIHYINKDLYLNAECFNIQKVVIRDAIDYFKKLFGGEKSLISNVNNLTDPDNSDAQNATALLSNNIIINYCPEGLIGNISAGALFAILQLAGLDISNYFSGLGDPNIKLEVMNAKNILDLSIILNSFKRDEKGNLLKGEDGNNIVDPDHALKLGLAISKDFTIRLAKEDMPTIAPPVGYVELSGGIPELGIFTTIALDFNTGKVANADFYQAPLDKLLGDMLAGMFADIIFELSVILDIQDALYGRVELEIFANLNPLNLLALKAQVNGYVSNGGTRSKVLQLNIFDGDLYIDLSAIHGPKFCIEEIMETLLGEKELKAEQKNAENGDADNEEDAEDRPQLDIEAEINRHGLVIFVRKLAFETLLGLFLDIDTIDMVGDLEARIKLMGVGNTIYLGAELEIDAPNGSTQEGDYMFKLGLGLEGLRVNFEPFDELTIITPQYQLYLKAHKINTIQLKTTLEIGINTQQGQLDIKDLFAALLKDNPLANTLPNKIFLENLGDILVVEIEAILNVFDVLNSLQIRMKIYSKNAPDNFFIDITYMKGDVYLDLSKLNLGKIVIEDVIGLFGSLMGAESQELFDNIKNIENSEDKSPSAQMSKVAAVIKLVLNAKDGLLLNLSKDVFNLIFTVLNLEDGLAQILGGVVDTLDPTLTVNFDPDLNFSIGIAINGELEGGEYGELIGAKLALKGKSVYVNVYNDLTYDDPESGGIGNLVPPIISVDERKNYLPYDQLTVYADVNITFTLELDKGNLSIDEILNMLVPGLQLNVKFKGNETIEIYIKGSFAIDFAKLLAKNPDGSRNLEQAKDAIVAHLNLGYALYDRDTEGNKEEQLYFSQDVLNIYIYQDVIYAKASILGDKDGSNSTVSVKMEGISLTEILLSLLDGTGMPDIDVGDIIGNEEDRNTSNPYSMLFGMFNEEKPLEGRQKLESGIYLNSHGLTVVIFGELIQSLLEMMGVGEGMDLNKLIKSVFTEGKLGVVVDNGFSIDITLTNDDEVVVPDKGYYRATLSLLHGLKLTTIREDYTNFYNYMSSPELLNFYSSCFDIKQLNNRLSAGLRVKLDANFKKHILDWSELFKFEQKTSYFYIVIAEAMQSTSYLSLQVDLDFMNLTKMALDAVLVLEDGAYNPILKIYFHGNLNSPNFGTEGPKIYMESTAMGIGKVAIDFPMVGNFLGIDLMELLNIKGMAPEERNQDGVESAKNEETTVPDDGDVGFIKPDGSFDIGMIGKILDSISINKGSLSIVIARTALASILNSLLGFPFTEIGEINISLSFIENTLSLDFGLDVPHVDEEGKLIQDLHFLVELGSINFHIGPNNILPTRDDPNYFSDFIPLNESKYELDAQVDLNISDKIGGVFDLTSLLSSFLPGANITLQSGENLDTTISLRIKAFIDFGDLRKTAIEIGIDYNKKPLINIIYQGTVDSNNKENGKVFVDLQGLGMPAITLENVNIGGLLLNLLSGVGKSKSGSASDPGGKVLNDVQLAEGSANAESRDDGIFDPDKDDWTKFQGLPLLLITASSKEVSIAITGALLTSLLQNSTLGLDLPELHSIKVGYSEEEDLAGLVVTLTSDEYSQAFKIKLGFGECFSGFGPHITSSIDPTKNNLGEPIVYEDVSILSKLSIGFDLGLRLKTKKPTGEKSDQIVALEKLLEGLVGLDRGAVNLDLQDSIMQLELKLNAYVDLANIKETALSLEVNYKEARLLAIYFYGKTNKVYADLSGLGLFKAQLNGIDIMSLIGSMLSGTDLIKDGVGVDVGGIIDGLLPQEETLSVKNADIVTKNPPLLNVIFGNTDIVVNPNMEFFGAIFKTMMPDSTFDFSSLPHLTDMRLTVNLMSGLLSNMDMRIKLDYENSLNIFIPEGGFRLRIGASSQEVELPPDLDEYGGIAGLSLGSKGGSLGADINIGALIGSLVDTLKLTNFSLFIDKKNAYWNIKTLTLPEYKEENGYYNPVTDDGSYVGYNGPTFRRTRLLLNKTNTNKLNADVELYTPGGSFLDIRGGISAGVKKNQLYIDLSKLTIKLGIININLGSMGLAPIDVGLLYLPGLASTLNLGGATEEVGTLYGNIKDNYGRNVQDATVSLNDDRISATKTDKDGNYAFVNVPVGNYTMTVNKDGFDQYISGERAVAVTSNKQGALPVVKDIQLIESVVFNDITIKGFIKYQVWDAAKNTFVEEPNYQGGITINGPAGMTGNVTGAGGAFTISITEYRSSVLNFSYYYDGVGYSFSVPLNRGVSEYERGIVGTIKEYKDITINGNLSLKESNRNGGFNEATSFVGQNIAIQYTNSSIRINVTTDANGNFSHYISKTTVPGFSVTHGYSEGVPYSQTFNETTAAGGQAFRYDHTVTKYFGINIDANYKFSTNGKIFGYGETPIDNEDSYGTLTVSEHSAINSTSGADGQLTLKETANAGSTLEFYSGRTYTAYIRNKRGATYYQKSFRVNKDDYEVKVMDTASYNEYSGTVSGIVTKVGDTGQPVFAVGYTVRMVNSGNGEITRGTVGEDGRYTLSFNRVNGNNYKLIVFNEKGEQVKDGDRYLEYGLAADIIALPVDSAGNPLPAGSDRNIKHDFGSLEFKGSISGSLKTLVGSSLVAALGSYELWLQIWDGSKYRTIMLSDSYDGTKHNTTGTYDDYTPRVYNAITEKELLALGKNRDQLFVSQDGVFTIKNLDISAQYRLNIRSKDYTNMDSNVDCKFSNTATDFKLEPVTLTSRTHWSQTHGDAFGSPISGIRIRLGADILDGNTGEDGHYNNDLTINGSPNPTYSNKFETGSADPYDNYIYVELWLAPTVVNGLINMVHGAIAEMLIGYQPISYDQRIELKTIGQNITDHSRSMTVYDYYYGSTEDYYNAVNALASKIPGGLIHGIIQMVGLRNLLKDVPDFLYNMILDLLQSILGTQLGGIISHLMPFANPYSVIESRMSNNNPMAQYLKDEGYDLKTLINDNTNKNLIIQDRSTYAKVTLNRKGTTFLDRITLLINGASYASAGNSGKVSNNNWNPNATEILTQKITYDPDGKPIDETNRLAHLRMIAWERYNVMNSYVISEEYATTGGGVKYLLSKTYIYDNYASQNLEAVSKTIDGIETIVSYKGTGNTNGKSMKDDVYTELDIANNGMDLKIVNKLGKYYRYDVTGGSGLFAGTLQTREYAAPDKVIFHDPFDQSDFTAIGGTWAGFFGGTRHSSQVADGETKVSSVLDILPNRNMASFTDGNSTDSDGVYLHWDTSKIPFGDPKGTSRDDTSDDYFIYGYVGSMTVSGKTEGGVEVVTQIRVDLDAIDIDPNSTYRIDNPANTKPLFDLPSIDPLTFVKEKHRVYDTTAEGKKVINYAMSLENAKAEYIKNNLPTMFAYDYESFRPTSAGGVIAVGKRIIFNDLTWNMKTINFTAEGGENFIELTYGYKSGTTVSETSRKATIKVPVVVKGRKITNINAKVTDSIANLVDNKISFNPLVHKDIKETILGLINSDYSIKIVTENGGSFTMPGDNLGETEATEWKIDSINANALDKYDKESVEEQVFTVYAVFIDSVGTTQEVPITVTVIERKILAYQLPGDSNIYSMKDPKNITLDPFRNGGLGLPNTIKVFYDSAYTQSEEFPLSAKDFEIPKFNFTFEGATKEYTVNIVLKGIIEQRVPIKYTVNKTELKGVDHIIITPYGDMKIPNAPLTSYLDGSGTLQKGNIGAYYSVDGLSEEFTHDGSIVYNGTTYYRNIKFTSPSFKGASYFVNVLFHDETFGDVVIRNVPLTLRTSLVTSLTLPSGYNAINPFAATAEIENLLNTPGISLQVFGEEMAISSDYFQIVSWRYRDGIGFTNNGKAQDIIVKVANKNFNQTTNNIWTQEVLVNVNTINNSVDQIISNEAADENGKEKNALIIENPYDTALTLPTLVTIITSDGRTVNNVPVLYSLKNNNLYEKDKVTIVDGARVGTNASNYQYFDIIVYNNAFSKVKSVVFKDAGGNNTGFDGNKENPGVTTNAFDGVNLPASAAVTMDNGKVYPFSIAWQNIETYDSITSDTVISAVARMGNKTFGYIDWTIYVKVRYETITANPMTDTVNIDPYEDIMKQLKEQLGENILVTTNLRSNVPVNFKLPNIDLTISGGTIDTELALGVDSNDTVYRQKFPLHIVLFERVASGLDNELSGNVYQQIDFNKLTKGTVLFTTGASMELPLKWDISGLEYTFFGGRYTVKATIDTTVAALRQTFNVIVNVAPTQLEAIYSTEDEKVEKLVVDPFIGFNNLPKQVYAKFIGSENKVLLGVDWDISKILATMSIQGGEYNGVELPAAVASVYTMKGTNKTAVQSIEIPVTVLEKAITDVQFSKDGETYESLSKDGEGYNYKMDINPYALTAAYSEKFGVGFSYYKFVKMIINGEEKEAKTFELQGTNYSIFDKATNNPTFTGDLYKGRDINVDINFGVVGEKGVEIAKDAYIKAHIDVTMLNMTYNGGLATDDGKVDDNNFLNYKLDVYGFVTKRKNMDDMVDGVKTLSTISGTNIPDIEVKFDKKDVNNSFEKLKNVPTLNDRKIGAINYNGGQGRLYATFGNAFGGIQKVIILLNYENRKVKELTFPFSDVYLKEYKAPGSDAVLTNLFVFDPFIDNVKTANDKYPKSANVIFEGDETKYTFEGITWDTGSVYFNFYGGNSTAKAILGAKTAAEQKINKRVRVKDRTVDISKVTGAINDENGNITVDENGNVSGYEIEPYKYNDVGDIASKVAKDVFNPSGNWFIVHFREGDPIGYQLGSSVTKACRVIKIDDGQGNITYEVDTQSPIPYELPKLSDKELVSMFSLDQSRPITSKGGYARFNVIIPSYALGAEAKNHTQKASFNIPCKEQYIIGYKFDETDATTSAIWQEYQTSGNITNIAAVSGYGYQVSFINPYLFINNGGIKMPDKVKVYVGAKEYRGSDKFEMSEYEFEAETYWSNSIDGKAQIAYNQAEMNTSFRLELDGQTFNVKFVVANSARWTLTNNLLFVETNSSYSEQQVILLPGLGQVNPDSAVKDKVRFSGNNNENMAITYGDTIVNFNGIKGGGNKLNSINRWNFRGVDFNSSSPQTATMVLGGRGGQEIKWQFKVSNKAYTNKTLQSLYPLAVGDVFTLPETYAQVFSRESNDIKKTGNIGIQYGTPKGDSTALTAAASGGSYIVTAKAVTNAKITDAEDKNVPIVIPWEPIGNRAYPGENVKMGGEIIFTVYPKEPKASGIATLYNPDAPNGFKSAVAGVPTSWTYPSGMRDNPNASGEAQSTYILDSSLKQNMIPQIMMNEDAMFDAKYLPNISLDDIVVSIPWQTAKVYYVKNPNVQGAWDEGNNNFGTELKGGLSNINSGRDILNSRVVGRYTIVVKMKINGEERQIAIALNITSKPF